MADLPKLLSHAWVAYAIEWDNAVELAAPHRTTASGGSGPWLTSLAMWHNCFRHLPPEGITVRELAGRAGLHTNVDGVRRWGYVTLETRGYSKANPLMRLRPTAAALVETWRSMFDEIDRRWHERFGSAEIARLRADLAELNATLDPGLPDCLPILGYGFAAASQMIPRSGSETQASLDVLLAKPLLAFAIDFESSGDLSCAMFADVVAHIPADGIELRHLPRRAGVSKEAIAMAVSYLSRRGYADVVRADGRKSIALTAAGGKAAASAEEHWKTAAGRFESAASERVARALAPLCGDGTAEGSRLFLGLEPTPRNWRSKVPKPLRLPDFPMVLHRGGYPDGS